MMGCLLPQSLNYTSIFHTGWDSSFKMRVFPSINKPGLGEKHTKQIHTSLSDKMLTDNFSNAKELIDTLFSLRKSEAQGNLKLSKKVGV